MDSWLSQYGKSLHLIAGMNLPFFLLALLSEQAIGVWNGHKDRGSILTANQQPYEVVLIRTYNPTDEMIARMKRMEKQSGRKVFVSLQDNSHMLIVEDLLKSVEAAASSPDAHEHLLATLPNRFSRILTRNSSESVRKFIPENINDIAEALVATAHQKLLRNFPGKVIQYSDEDVDRYFPELGKRGCSRDRINRHTYGWQFHEECIYTVFKNYEKQFHKPFPTEAGLWVMEDDVEYTGNWKEFFDRYAGSADLVTSLVKSTTSEYFTKHMGVALPCTQSFIDQFVHNKKILPEEEIGRMYHHAEHVVFYSGKLRKVMDKFQLQKGHHYKSEFSTATFAKAMGFSIMDINKDDIWIQNGSQGRKGFVGRKIDKNSVEELRRSNISPGLLHPCKY
eukprot:jgi/Bigna1/77050/fgenesh1_pg.45_\